MRRGAVGAASAGLVVLGVLLALGAASPPPMDQVDEASPAITTIASSPTSRTLAIRGGRVEWLSLHPARWAEVVLPTRCAPPGSCGSMHPTAVAVTNTGVGLVGLSNGFVLAVAPGARNAAAVVADYMPGRVVALAGIGTIGHLQLLVSTAVGTYSVGLQGPLAVWWPHRVATALVAPVNSQGAWAALVAGRLAWAATPEQAPAGEGASWSCPSFTFASGPQPKPSKGACAMPGPPARWTLASSADLGRNALLAESPDGIVAVATHRGAVLTGDPGEGLSSELRTVATGPLGPAATPMGLVATYSPSGVGNVLALVAAGTPLLVDGWSGWETAGGPVRVRLAAGVGSDVVEVQPSGPVRVVNLYQPGLAYAAPQRAVPSWVGPALGLAALGLAALVLGGLAWWRLPRRPRAVGLLVAGVLLVAAGGVTAGRFMVPIGRYTRGQIQWAWLNGVVEGGQGSAVMLTVAQCHQVAEAVGWRGPLPTSITVPSALRPGEMVPSCQEVFSTPGWWRRVERAEPLTRNPGGGPVEEWLSIDLGPDVNGLPGSPAAAACSSLGARCQPGIVSRMPNANVVSLTIPAKAARLASTLFRQSSSTGGAGPQVPPSCKSMTSCQGGAP